MIPQTTLARNHLFISLTGGGSGGGAPAQLTTPYQSDPETLAEITKACKY